MIVCNNISKEYKHGSARKRVLSNVNLTVNPGERVALLGRNGAGKSTLIKLIAGVEMPTSGKVTRKMSVSWPLGLGGGFQGSLTGYDNARFIARIYQRDYSQIKDFVEDFSELGRQLRMPVKTYSSGMRARLAFALSLAIEFDCYLIDEITAVGDAKFHEKCAVELFHKRGDRAMLIISHDTEYIRHHCSRFAVLNDGKLLFYPDFEQAMNFHAQNLRMGE